MADTTERRGLSLRTRITVVSILLVALPVVAAMGAAFLFGDRIARHAVEDSLSRSEAVNSRFEAQRAEQLALISRLFSSDAAFSGYMAEALGGGSQVDALSIADLLAERQAELGFDFAIVMDPEGRTIARTDRADAGGEDLSNDPLVARLLEELVPTTGIWRSADDLYQAAAIPLAKDFRLIGLLVTGLAIDDEFAEEISRVAGTDIAFLVRGGEGFRPVASSFDTSDLVDVIDRIDGVSHVELTLDGRRLVGRIDPVVDLSGELLGAKVALTSAERPLQAFLNIRRVVLIAGGISLVVAALLSFLLARRMLEPVAQLAEAAVAATKGDFTKDIPVPKDGELRRVAYAFNALLGDLRERREMQEYVTDIARYLPDPLAAYSSSPSDETDVTVQAGAAPVAEGALAVGQLLAGRYEIVETLGSGGMGVVYKAHDRELNELVAIKVLRTSTDLARLKDEIKLARKITHPNVLRTFDYGEYDGLPYISMEYVRGLTLQYLLRQKGRLPLASGLFLARQLCDGLIAAHDVGVIHRDIKPANLILQHNGNAKLMDFGVAVSFGASGNVAGTPVYMPPEQIRGEPTDVRADIYAVGALLYRMFSGKRPFRSHTIHELSAEKQTPPDGREDALPEALTPIIVRCLAPAREDRFPDVATLARELRWVRP